MHRIAGLHERQVALGHRQHRGLPVHALQDKSGMDREAAMLAMTERYLALMQAGDPVHTWPVG